VGIGRSIGSLHGPVVDPAEAPPPGRHAQESVGECIGGRFTVDLSAVEYLDSAAINSLFVRADRIRLIAHHLLMSVLTIIGLAELVTIEPAPPTAQH
jgi:hypothetical protein